MLARERLQRARERVVRFEVWAVLAAAVLTATEWVLLSALYPGVSEYWIQDSWAFRLRLLLSAVGAGAVAALVGAALIQAFELVRPPHAAASLAGGVLTAALVLGIGLFGLGPALGSRGLTDPLSLIAAGSLGAAGIAAALVGAALFRRADRRDPGHLARGCAALVAVVAALGFGAAPSTTAPDARSTRSPAAGPVLGPVPVVLVSVDTLRASHMSLHGYELPTTPKLAAWAGSQAVFDNAIVSKTFTCPSLATLLTGLEPTTHTVRKNGTPLPKRLTTLPETLREEGYSTGGFSANPLVKKSALHQGFSHWKSYPRTRAEHVLSDAWDWLEGHAESRPFLWVHLFDPHHPYTPPDPFDDRFEGSDVYARYSEISYEIAPPSPFSVLANFVSPTFPHAGRLGRYTRRIVGWEDKDRVPRPEFVASQYDGEIAYTDVQVTRFLRRVRTVIPNALVVFTSDHGESMVEHDFLFKHGRYCYEPTAHVPLVFSHPSFEAGRISRVVGLVDLRPTLASLLGLAGAGRGQGRSLAPLLEERGEERTVTGDPRAVRIESMSMPGYPTIAIRTADEKLVLTPKRAFAPLNALLELQLSLALPDSEPPSLLVRNHFAELYELDGDADETQNMAWKAPERVRELRARLFRRVHSEVRDRRALGLSRDDGASQIDEETRKMLEALGYAK